MSYAADIWRSKLVVSFRGHDFANLPKIYGADMYRSVFRRADAITTTSEFGRQQVIKLGCDAENVYRVYSPTPVDEYAVRERGELPKNRVKLITVGRLVPIKGQEWVIRAMADIVTKYPEVVYEVVGDGPNRGKLEMLVKELGLERSIHFAGAATSEQVADALSRADIFVMPSMQEALGNAAVEAMASGLPVVASDVGGLPEVVKDGVTGLLAPPGGAKEIGQKVIYLLDRPEIRSSMGRAGRAYAEGTFDIAVHMDQIIGVYESVCERSASA
jgi:colanic acid/amylovoran biosynthesis glycosyltransferase